ncbi:MAG: HEPN domain-containing protein [Phycisphaerae bacterium]|nr:HEPN domain-containing protein [Phycisphaerae bacterium]
MPHDPADVQSWLIKAQHDWTVARRLLTPDVQELDVIGFHCQQAVEKLLKAFLLMHDVEFELTHDLRRLLHQCVILDPQFETFRAEVPPLTLYAVAFRYPGPADPTFEYVQAALDVVARVWKFVTARLPANIVPPQPEEI